MGSAGVRGLRFGGRRRGLCQPCGAGHTGYIAGSDGWAAVSEDTGADCAAADAEDGSEVGRRHLQSQGTDDCVQHRASDYHLDATALDILRFPDSPRSADPPHGNLYHCDGCAYADCVCRLFQTA